MRLESDVSVVEWKDKSIGWIKSSKPKWGDFKKEREHEIRINTNTVNCKFIIFHVFTRNCISIPCGKL